MQLTELLHLTIPGRSPVEIPNIGRDGLAVLFHKLGFRTGAEIGVERGRYSETLCIGNPGLLLYCIDPWLASVYPPGTPTISQSQEEFNQMYLETKVRLAPYNCDIIRMKSSFAIDSFQPDSLDFVYIDGNHEFIEVANDIVMWSQIVRPGGIIAGHDYAYFPQAKRIHVKHVVHAYTRAYGINPWFILGAEACHQPGVIRDPYRSWMWVKA